MMQLVQHADQNRYRLCTPEVGASHMINVAGATDQWHECAAV